MTKASKTRKFAQVKRMLAPKAIKQYKDDVLNPNKKDTSIEKLPRNVPNTSAALFSKHNGPPHQALVDTNFINFSIQNKLDLEKAMMDCLCAKCTRCITDGVMAEWTVTFNPAMKLAYHRAMLLTQFYWRPSQQVPWRAMYSNKWSCSLSLVQINFSLTACSSVHTSLAHGPQLVSSLGRKVGQSRCRVSGIVVNTKSGTEEEHRISYEELGRYGIDESDYADMMTQVSDEHQTSSSSKIKTQKRKAPYEVVDRTKDDPEDSEDVEFVDDAEVDGKYTV